MSLPLRIAMPALLLASSAGVALAQQAAAPQASASGATTGAAKAASSAPPPGASATPAESPAYRSAFEGYRPLTDQPVLRWRESNDVVGRIGGWQAYSREGQGGAPAGAAEIPVKAPASIPDAARNSAGSAVPPKAASAPDAAPAAMPGGHTGHKP